MPRNQKLSIYSYHLVMKPLTNKRFLQSFWQMWEKRSRKRTNTGNLCNSCWIWKVGKAKVATVAAAVAFSIRNFLWSPKSSLFPYSYSYLPLSVGLLIGHQLERGPLWGFTSFHSLSKLSPFFYPYFRYASIDCQWVWLGEAHGRNTHSKDWQGEQKHGWTQAF